MAGTTYTASDQLAQPKANHIGINVAKAVYSSTTCLSASDVILMVKIPFNATIIDGYVSGTIDSAGSTIKCGYQGSDAALMSTHTVSATSVLWRFDAVTMPVAIGGSDDAQPRYKYVIITVVATASVTASSSLTVVVEYAVQGAI